MGSLDEARRADVKAAILAGRKIEAIQIYREAVPGTALVDAKKAVEEMQAQLRREHPENYGPATSKTGCLGIMTAMAGVAGGIAFLTARTLFLN